jgi:hypothetical protein
MEIGETEKVYVIEPLEDPFERPAAPEPETVPVETPEREKVPA